MSILIKAGYQKNKIQQKIPKPSIHKSIALQIKKYKQGMNTFTILGIVIQLITEFMTSENGTYKSGYCSLSLPITIINMSESCWENFPEFINELTAIPPTILQDVIGQV